MWWQVEANGSQAHPKKQWPSIGIGSGFYFGVALHLVRRDGDYSWGHQNSLYDFVCPDVNRYNTTEGGLAA